MSEPRWNDAGTREPPRQPPMRASGGQPTMPLRPAGPGPEPGKARSSGRGRNVSPRWGELPPVRGIVLVVSAAGVGALLTIVTGNDPGFLLGVMVVAGTIAASLAVSARRAYLIIPAPALAYLAAAILAGLIHDRAADTSRTLLAINAGRWVASGFLAMAAATVLAVLITVARWSQASRGTGYRQLPPGRGLRPPPSGHAQRPRDSKGPGGRHLPR